MHKYLYIVLIFCSLFVTTAAFTMPVEDFVTEANTYITQAQSIANTINTGKNLINTGTMLQNQMRNLTKLNFQTWDNAQEALSKLGNSAKMASGSLTYSTDNIDSQFSQVFPGYNEDTANYSQSFQKWNKANNATQRGTMDQMQESYKQLNEEQQTDSTLASKANSAVGQMQAEQVGNEIGAEQLAQTQKLRATVMAQTSSQAAYYAYQSQKDATSQKSVDQVTQNADSKYPAYQDVSEFGLIPEFK